MSNEELTKHDHVLLGLVYQFQTMAMVSLGKIQNPATGQIDRDLEHARAAIDVLEMLKVKCRAETPEPILRVVDGAVLDLQLNYMEETKKSAQDGDVADEGTPAEADPGEGSRDTAAAAEGTAPDAAADPGEEDEV